MSTIQISILLPFFNVETNIKLTVFTIYCPLYFSIIRIVITISSTTSSSLSFLSGLWGGMCRLGGGERCGHLSFEEPAPGTFFLAPGTIFEHQVPVEPDSRKIAS